MKIAIVSILLLNTILISNTEATSTKATDSFTVPLEIETPKYKGIVRSHVNKVPYRFQKTLKLSFGQITTILFQLGCRFVEEKTN